MRKKQDRPCPLFLENQELGANNTFKKPRTGAINTHKNHAVGAINASKKHFVGENSGTPTS